MNKEKDISPPCLDDLDKYRASDRVQEAHGINQEMVRIPREEYDALTNAATYINNKEIKKVAGLLTRVADKLSKWAE